MAASKICGLHFSGEAVSYAVICKKASQATAFGAMKEVSCGWSSTSFNQSHNRATLLASEILDQIPKADIYFYEEPTPIYGLKDKELVEKINLLELRVRR